MRILTVRRSVLLRANDFALPGAAIPKASGCQCVVRPGQGSQVSGGQTSVVSTNPCVDVRDCPGNWPVSILGRPHVNPALSQGPEKPISPCVTGYSALAIEHNRTGE